ncbi:helix-turn-helix domain-containing protein [Stenotrophomonas sp. SY1]|uniref:helix-turn-helix domain-containing protein n=1 Tax=Stenotrophomonas sp. SY1 TaxID=477235 RepID=UPI001E5143DD|nr:helix-turn-helix domain-containing protein [Stenotrophomonas sp. SY1]
MSASNVELMTEKRALVVGGPAGTIVWLTCAEHCIYKQLLQAGGELVTHANLSVALYGGTPPAKSNCLQVLVSRLRKKLATAGANQRIRNTRKIGYQLLTVGVA